MFLVVGSKGIDPYTYNTAWHYMEISSQIYAPAYLNCVKVPVHNTKKAGRFPERSRTLCRRESHQNFEITPAIA
jgi:hypothetical protein